MADTDFQISIGAKLEDGALENIKKQVQDLTTNKDPIKIKLNTSDAEKQIAQLKKDLQDLAKTASSIGFNTKAGSSNTNVNKVNSKYLDVNSKTAGMVNDMNADYKKLKYLAEQISKIEIKMKGLDVNKDVEQIKTLESLCRSLIERYHELVQSSPRMNDWHVEELNKQIEKTGITLDKVIAKTRDLSTSKLNLFEKTKDSDLSNLDNDLKKIQTQSESTKNAVNDFRKALEQMNNVARQEKASPQDILSAYSKYQEALKVAKTNISADLKRNVNDLDRQKLSNNMQQWLNQNTKAAKAFGNEVRELIAELKNCDNVSFGNIKRQFSNLQAQAKAQGLTGQSFLSSIGSKMKELSAYYTAADVLQRGVQVVEDMARNVAAVDKSMTELYRVTDLSEQAYDSLYSTMVADAKQYGAELDTLINSTASWVRLGFGADEAEKLAGVSAMYQHVTDLDEKTAVENLVTTYKGYQNQLLEITNGDSVKAVSLISDKLDALGNKLPVTASDVGAAMTRMSSVAEMAGASIDEAMGMIVGSGAVTQDFEKTANALRTSMLRIRGKRNMPPYAEMYMLCA